MTTFSTAHLPGRLGTPAMVLKDEPRIDPRLLAALAACGIDGPPPPAGVDKDSPHEVKLQYIQALENAYIALFNHLISLLPPIAGVTSRTEVIKGVDGNDISLYIHRPSGSSGTLPCIVYFHGGAMSFLTAADRLYTHWQQALAATGMVVVGVEFRNAAGVLGAHPFPAGLNDCVAAVRWVDAHRAALEISKIVLSGESGGGNLSLATTLKAKREGWVDRIAGVYAMCPYISNTYGAPVPELPSLVENDGYFMAISGMAVVASVYDPTGANATNPLAWPFHATKADLEGLPPHAISLNELDPLRDEGRAYFLKLLHAGNRAICRTVNGTTHAAELSFPGAIPEVFRATLRDIAGFVGSL